MGKFEIVTKRALAPTVTLLEIAAPRVAQKARAGHFVLVRVDEQGERVPLTIADRNPERGTITIVFQQVGHTTQQLSRLEVGEALRDVLGPLGQATEVKQHGRVVCVAGGVGLSRWLAVFAFLLFLSLALAKRHGELMALAKEGGRDVRGRGYGVGHLPLVRWVGQGAALLAGVTIVLYSQSASARVVYATPLFLYGVAAVFVVWVGRLWWLARRGVLHEDPLVFTSRDEFSYGMAALTDAERRYLRDASERLRR